MKKIIPVVILIFFFPFLSGFAQDEKTIMLDSVLVQVEAPGDISHVPAHYIDKQQVRDVPSRDVGEYLRSIPNVSGIRKGGSAVDPVVRGFKYSQLNVILNNGVKIENGCPNRMDPVSSHIESEDIEKIEIIKGPFSLRYGPSFGGVINLVSPEPAPSKEFELHGSALYGMESNWDGKKVHGSFYGGKENVFFHLSGGFRDYGNYRSGGSEGTDTTFNSAMRKYNYTGKLGFALDPRQKIVLSYDGVHGRDVMYPALSMDEKSDDTHMLSLDYSGRALSPSISSLDVKLYRSDVHHVMDNSHRANYQTMQMVADVNALNTGGNAALTIQLKQNRFVIGLDFENIKKDGKRTGTMSMMGTTSTKITNLWKEALIRNTGVFAEYKAFFGEHELNASLRGDYNTATSEDTLQVIRNEVEYFGDANSRNVNLSASIGLTRTLTPWLNVSLALGRGVRSPNMLERYIKLLPVGYDRYDYLGNPQLKPEVNNEADLTIRLSGEHEGSLYINFFYSYVQDYITANLLPSSVISPQSQGVLGVKQFHNTEYILNRGFELGYKSPEKYKLKGDLIAAYTYGTIPKVTKYIISGSQVVDAIEIKNDALPEIPPLEATANLYYEMLDGKLTPRITFRAVAAQRHTSEAFYETYTPGFWLMNFSLKSRLSRHAMLLAGVTNVFDKAYYEHLNRRIIGTNQNLYEPGRVFYATVSLNI